VWSNLFQAFLKIRFNGRGGHFEQVLAKPPAKRAADAAAMPPPHSLSVAPLDAAAAAGSGLSGGLSGSRSSPLFLELDSPHTASSAASDRTDASSSNGSSVSSSGGSASNAGSSSSSSGDSKSSDARTGAHSDDEAAHAAAAARAEEAAGVLAALGARGWKALGESGLSMER
jgi:hypothetical protein